MHERSFKTRNNAVNRNTQSVTFNPIAQLIATILTVWLFQNKRIRFLHESGLAIAYGLAVGLVIALVSESEPVSKRVVALLEEESRSMEEGVTPLPPDELIYKVDQPVSPSEGSAKDRDEMSTSQTRAYTYAFIGEKAGQSEEEGVREKATFNPEIFFYVLLPPIIFHAGYSMRRKQVSLCFMGSIPMLHEPA